MFYSTVLASFIENSLLSNFLLFLIFFSPAEEYADKSIAQSKAYDALQLQIWSMLRGFCDHPTDVKQVSYRKMKYGEIMFCKINRIDIKVNENEIKV